MPDQEPDEVMDLWPDFIAYEYYEGVSVGEVTTITATLKGSGWESGNVEVGAIGDTIYTYEHADSDYAAQLTHVVDTGSLSYIVFLPEFAPTA